jgi:hypothetical protein
MHAVYLSERIDDEFNQRVAIKILQGSRMFFAAPSMSARFSPI